MKVWSSSSSCPKGNVERTKVAFLRDASLGNKNLDVLSAPKNVTDMLP